MPAEEVTYVQKACANITCRKRELLVFGGPGHDRAQIPKGTVEPDETPREALGREIGEESGLDTLQSVRHLTTDIWIWRRTPPKRYIRHFFHVTVDDPRNRWTHVVTGDGAEVGCEFTFHWLNLPTTHTFALDLDDYLHRLSWP